MSAFSKTHVARATICPEGSIVSCNESFARLLMQCRRKVDEYKLKFFIAGEDWCRMEKILQMGKTSQQEGKFSLLAGEDKCSILVRLIIRPLLDKNFGIDIEDLSSRVPTTLQNADQFREIELLREAIRSRDDFLSVAVHELKTPLTSICLQVDGMLRVHGNSNRKIPEWLGSKLLIVQRQCRRLAHLMNELLDVSRIQTGRFDLVQEEIDLGSLVKDIVEQFHYEASVAGCMLSMHTSRHVIGRWDRCRLDQLVTNLLSNAIKYGAGKPIEISVGEANKWGWIKVRDYGIGIPLESQERIFQRFERTVNARRYRGLGLGLWISSQIVHRLGGRISVESEPGNGACFTVELPCHEYANDFRLKNSPPNYSNSN
jgi:signal transduction histidine kinase